MPLSTKKVAIIHYTAPKGEAGGVETVILNHIEHILKYTNMKIHLIYGMGGGGGWNGLISEHKIPELHGFHPKLVEIQERVMEGEIQERLVEFNRIKEHIKAKLRELLKEIDICIVHNIPAMPFNFPLTIAINELTEELSDIKFIYWIHDSIVFREEQWFDRLDEYPFTCLHYQGENIQYVTITEMRAKQFREAREQFCVEDVTVIPNGIDIDEYLKLDSITMELKELLGITNRDYVILVPVRVTPRKNIELALHVVSKLEDLLPAKAGQNIKLLVSGPPDNQAYVQGVRYLNYLRDLSESLGISHNVIYCSKHISKKRDIRPDGTIAKWSVSDIYTLADLILIPSKEEGFGLPIIEAGAARKPLFCSRIRPFTELVKDGIDAHMFSLDEDPERIAFRIYRYLISDIVDLNFRNVLDTFTWERIVKDQVLSIL